MVYAVPWRFSPAAGLQASLDVAEVFILERLDQLEKVHQKVLQKEGESEA